MTANVPTVNGLRRTGEGCLRLFAPPAYEVNRY